MVKLACEGLGEFGTVKIERKRFIRPKPCRRGLHMISGSNLAFAPGHVPVCRACHNATARRHYWARCLRDYFETAA